MRAELPGSPPRMMGNAILRVTYHYWFHTGEILAIRQLLATRAARSSSATSNSLAPYRALGRGDPPVRSRSRSSTRRTPARRLERRATGRPPTGSATRSRPPAGGWSTAARTSAWSRRIRPISRTRPGVRYGRSDAVPSRLGEPSTARPRSSSWPRTSPTTWTGRSRRSGRPRRRGRRSSSSRTRRTPRRRIACRSRGSGEADRIEVEVVRTSARLGWGAAWNIGLRRACGDVVILMDTSVEPTGDIVTPLAAALAAGTSRSTGAFGLRSADLRRFEEVSAGEAAAIEGYLLAFRRADASAAGPLDEGFRFYRNLDIWWSLDAARPRRRGPTSARRRGRRAAARPARASRLDVAFRWPSATGCRSGTSTGSSSGSATARTSPSRRAVLGPLDWPRLAGAVGPVHRLDAKVTELVPDPIRLRPVVRRSRPDPGVEQRLRPWRDGIRGRLRFPGAVQVEAEDRVRVEDEPAALVGRQVGAQDRVDGGERPSACRGRRRSRPRTARAARVPPAESGAACMTARSRSAGSGVPSSIARPRIPDALPGGRSADRPARKDGRRRPRPVGRRRPERRRRARSEANAVAAAAIDASE